LHQQQEIRQNNRKNQGSNTILQSSSPDELKEVRINLITRMNESIDIPFIDEKQEQVYCTIIVDFHLKKYGLAKGTNQPHEELMDVEYEIEGTQIQLEAQRAVNTEKEADFVNKLENLEKRKKELFSVLSLKA